MIEPLSEEGPIALGVLRSKINELVKGYNELEKKYDNHVHYAREMQFPTSTPDNPNVHQ